MKLPHIGLERLEQYEYIAQRLSWEKLVTPTMMFVDPCIIVQFLQRKPNKMQQCIKILLILFLN